MFTGSFMRQANMVPIKFFFPKGKRMDISSRFGLKRLGFAFFVANKYDHLFAFGDAVIRFAYIHSKVLRLPFVPKAHAE